MVVQSKPGDDFNAIDPNLCIDSAGQPWLAYGSYWTGIKLRRLGQRDGKLVKGDEKIYSLARRTVAQDGTRAVEAPYIVHKGRFYYLFVSFDRQPTKYNIRVGRSLAIIGPYLDADGRDMAEGGGTVVLRGDDNIVAPGHNGILMNDAGRDWLVCHYKDATQNGKRTLQIRSLRWSPDGWPTVSEPLSRRH